MIFDYHAGTLGDAIPLHYAEKIGVRSIATDDEIPPEFAEWAGEGATPALIFPHPDATTGAITLQLRPDDPVVGHDGKPRKYLWPKGSPLVFTIHDEHRSRLTSPSSTVLLVEGTKQTIAAAAWAPDGVAVVGIGGIWGHRDRELGMLADVRGLRLGKRRVVIVPDADYSTNPAVFDGLRDLVGTFDPLTGGKVTVAKLSALGGKTGLDDYLAGLGEDQRAEVIGNLIETSGRQFGKRPRESKVFEIADKVSFFTAGFARSLVETFAGELAVDELDEQLLVRYAGVWTPALRVPAVRAFLLDGSGESYSERRIATVVELAASRLQLAGETVPERPTEPVVAFRNGIVRLDERPQLRPFAGQPATRIRFPIEWDDESRCPVYDEWIAEQTAGEDDPLLVAQVLGQVFDTFRSPERHALLYGPSRSGKSTLIRLAQAMISPEHRSYVSLHDMSNDRFATSDLIGSRLNAAADLSAASVRDLAEFKKVTGDDVVRVQAKYEKARWLHPTAVHLFSANSIPAIGEDSRAYLNRVVPISFPKTFEGREDPDVERAMLAELPAIAGTWLEAHAVRIRDGVWAKTDPATQAEFELASDPVRQFLDDETVADGWTNRATIYGAYREWAGVNGLNPKAAARFYASCQSAGIEARKLAIDRQLRIRLRAATTGHHRAT